MFSSRLRRPGRGRFGPRLKLQFLEERVTPTTLIHTLLPNETGPQAGTEYGTSIAANSMYRVIGAPGADVFGLGDVGQVYVYDVTDNNLIFTIDHPSPNIGARFGTSLSISNHRLVIGADGDKIGSTKGGSAFVYDLSSPSPTIPIATLPNPNPANGDEFGHSVSLSGTYAVVGASQDDVNATDSGSAYVYDLDSVTPFLPILTLANPAPAANDQFGIAVSMSGSRIVIGADGDSFGATSAGSVYVFDLASSTPTVPVLTIHNPTPSSFEYFGGALTLVDHLVLVGAIQDRTASDKGGGAAYLFDLDLMSPTIPLLVFDNPTPTFNEDFGASVAMSGNEVVIGAMSDNAAGLRTGAAYVYDLSSISPTTPVLTLLNPQPAQNDRFGVSVAWSGTTLNIGASMDDSAALNGGSVYLFDLSLPNPSMPIGQLNKPLPAEGDWFGFSVAASANYLVTGAHGDDTDDMNEGSVAVYNLASATPTSPVAILRNPLPTSTFDFFGYSVATSGSIVVVGAPFAQSTGTLAGLVYVFDMNSSTPTVPIAKLADPSPVFNDNFGQSVAIGGKYVVVGVPGYDSGANCAGSVQIFDLTSLTAPIATINNPTPAIDDFFGVSVAISGSLLVVGASRDDTGATDAGSAYIYDLNSMTLNTPVAILNNPLPANVDRFGFSVAISGNHVVIGALQDDAGAIDAGAAYVYDLAAVNPTLPIAFLNNPAPNENDLFGNSVAISGGHVIVGAHQDDAGASNSGAAYIYDLDSSNPSMPTAVVTNPSANANDLFGYSVAVAGNTAIVGAYQDDTLDYDEGAVYVYDLRPAATITSLVVNGQQAQRARVTSIAMAFDQAVTLPSNPADAFVLRRQSDNSLVTLNANVNGNSVTFTFVGGPIEFGSLADGRYTLTALASKINGGLFDGNADGIGGDNYVLVGTPANGLFRLFGDANGDGRVTAIDYNAFRIAWATNNMTFDFNNDGIVTAADFSQFRLRYGMMI